MELVSIVIPVYNVESYLDECITSVINQSYQKIEIILVDDGSTDNSSKLCDSYAKQDSRIRVIHQENRGLSVARNVGMECSTGKYIYFLDSDDYISSNAIQIMYEVIEKEKSDLVFFDANTFFDDRDCGLCAIEYKRKRAYGNSQGAEMLLKLHLDGVFYTAVPLMMMNHEYIRRINLKFYPGILHEDNLFTVIAYLNAKKVTHIHKMLYYRRMRENSIMTVSFSKRNFLGYSTCIQKLIPYYLEANENISKRNFLKRFLKERMNWTVNGFFLLDSSEQRCLIEDFNKLSYSLEKCSYFHDKRIKFKMRHRKIWKLLFHLRKIMNKR